MARVGGIVVCLLIIIMDVAAGILGFEAEIAQNKVCMLESNILEYTLHIIFFCFEIINNKVSM